MSYDLPRTVGFFPDPLQEGAQPNFRPLGREIEQVFPAVRSCGRAAHFASELTFNEASKVQEGIELERRATDMFGQENPYQPNPAKIRLCLEMPEPA